MRFIPVVLFALLATSISCKYGDGCYNAHEFAQKMNYVVTNGGAVANEYYKSSHWMNNGQSTGRWEAGCYTEAHNYMKSNSRRAYKESTALNLSSLYTTYWQNRNKQMSHYCKGSPQERANIFQKGSQGVAENVAWSSNIRDCGWAILAWITDEQQP